MVCFYYICRMETNLLLCGLTIRPLILKRTKLKAIIHPENGVLSLRKRRFTKIKRRFITRKTAFYHSENGVFRSTNSRFFESNNYHTHHKKSHIITENMD